MSQSGASGQRTAPGEDPIDPHLPTQSGHAASAGEHEDGPLGAFAGNPATDMASYGAPHAESAQMGFAFNAVYAPPPPPLQIPDRIESKPLLRSVALHSSGNMRNTYTIEMKIKVAERGLEKGRNVAAKEFGLNASMVGRWIRSIDTMRESIGASVMNPVSEPYGSGSSIAKRRRLPDGVAMISGGRRRDGEASGSGTGKGRTRASKRNDGEEEEGEDNASEVGSSSFGQAYASPAGATLLPSVQPSVGYDVNAVAKGKAQALQATATGPYGSPIPVADRHPVRYASPLLQAANLPAGNSAATSAPGDPLMMNLYFNGPSMTNPYVFQSNQAQQMSSTHTGVFQQPEQQMSQQQQQQEFQQRQIQQSQLQQQQQLNQQHFQQQQKGTPMQGQTQAPHPLHQSLYFQQQQQPLSLNNSASSSFMTTVPVASQQLLFQTQQPHQSQTIPHFHQTHPLQQQNIQQQPMKPQMFASSSTNLARNKLSIAIAINSLKNELDTYNYDPSNSMDDPVFKDILPGLKDAVDRGWPLAQEILRQAGGQSPQ